MCSSGTSLISHASGYSVCRIPYTVYGIPSPTDLQLIASNCEQASRKPNARRVFSSALHISAMFIINELSLSLVSVCKSSGNYSASLAARK